MECPSSCSICYGAEFCIACHAGHYLFENMCISDGGICIANGYYPIGTTCVLCSMPCGTCEMTATNCLSCLSGYIFYEGKCITDCAAGLFRYYDAELSATTCKACSPSCLTCTSTPDYCFRCQAPALHVPSSMSCVDNCPDMTYNQVLSSCLPFSYPCLLCTSDSACLSCLTGTLIGTSCYTSCPDGQFSNPSNICQSC